MNDVKDLLERALADGHGPDPARPPSPPVTWPAAAACCAAGA